MDGTAVVLGLVTVPAAVDFGVVAPLAVGLALALALAAGLAAVAPPTPALLRTRLVI